jgi:hypothetical protein
VVLLLEAAVLELELAKAVPLLELVALVALVALVWPEEVVCVPLLVADSALV